MTDPSSDPDAMEDVPTPLPTDTDGGDDDDTEPVFLTEGDGEEVVVDDSAPIPDEEDDIDMTTDAMAGDDAAPVEPTEDTEPGESVPPLLTLTHHRGPIYTVDSRAIPNTATLMIGSGSGDDTAHHCTVDIATGETTATVLSGHSESVAVTKFSTDSQLLATTDYSGVISIWNTPANAKPTLDRTLPAGPSDVEWLSWHPLGNVFAVGSTDGTIWMYLAKTGGVMQVFAGHDPANENGGGGVTSDGRHLLSGGGEGSFRIWNPKTGVARTVIKDGQEGSIFVKGQVTCLHQQIGGDKSNIAVGGSDGVVGIVNLNTKKAVACLSHSNVQSEAASVEVLRWSPQDIGNGLLLASGGVDGNVKVWENGMVRSTLNHPQGGITCFEWLEGMGPNERQLAVGCADGRVRVWDTRLTEGGLLKKLDGHTDMVLCLSVTDRVIVAGGDDHLINVWKI